MQAMSRHESVAGHGLEWMSEAGGSLQRMIVWLETVWHHGVHLEGGDVVVRACWLVGDVVSLNV